MYWLLNLSLDRDLLIEDFDIIFDHVICCILMFNKSEQELATMSKLSINQASKLFKVSRNTIYARIKKGDITKDSEGLVSAQDMMRLFGNRTDKKATEKAVIELLNSREQTVQKSEQDIEQLKGNTEQLLLQQIEQLKLQVEQLEKQLEYVKANEAWLKQQLDQRLIEHKNSEKKGLLSKLFG